jgi:hypothetical protein
MSVTLATIRNNAKALAQDPAGRGLTGLGVGLLLSDPGDYDLAIRQALRTHDQERPNMRVVDQVLASAGFRYVLAGSGALSSLIGMDAFVDGSSFVDDVFLPWDLTSQNQTPLDRNTWRTLRDPGPKTILEFLDQTATAGDTLRLVFRNPHTLTEAPNTVASPTAAPGTALAGAGAGNVNDGTHSYVYTWTTAWGETAASPAAAAVTVANKALDGKVTVTIPASADSGITGAKVYRTVAGDTGSRKLVGTLTSTTGGGTFTDNVADGSLGTATAPATNTAGGQNTVLDGDADAFAVLAAAYILEMAAVKAVQNTGNTGLPNDVVDRRNQSDIFKSRSAEYLKIYKSMIGTLAGENGPGAASAWADLDVTLFNGFGSLWHGTGNR